MTDWPHGTGVPSISRSISALPGVWPASHRSAASISGAIALSRSLYSLWDSSFGNRCPMRAAQPATWLAQRRDDAVGQLDVECDQKSVQVGDHEDSQGQTCVDTPILDTLRLSVTDHRRRAAALPTGTDFPVNDLDGTVQRKSGIRRPL